MSVLSSRRLWTFIIAQAVTLVTLLVGHYVTDPFYGQIAAVVISTAEGLAGILIVAYTVDDVRGNAQHIQADKEVQIRAIDCGVHPDYPAK